jgi:hypothetical protein
MPALGKGAKGAAQVVLDEQAVFEHKRKQEVLLRTRLEDLMKEEEASSRLYKSEILERWVRILRHEKMDELLGEIDILRHTFEKTLDRKNAVIAMLAVDMDEAEEQYRLALRTHLTNIDALIDLQNRRMTDLDAQFEKDLLEMKQDFDLERAEIQRKHEIEKADLKLILDNMQHDAVEGDRALQEETSESHETAMEKMDEELKQMKGELSKYNEHLRHQISEKFDEFVNNATVNMKEYIHLTGEDEKTADKIASQMRKIQKLQESIGTWKSNLSNNIRECEERNNALRAEKETIAQHFKDLKARMQLWRRGEEKRLAELVSNARETKKTLEKRAQEAERILRVTELCSQLETEREKVLGFDSDITVDEVSKEISGLTERRQQLQATGQVAPVVTMTDLFATSTQGLTDADFVASSAEEWKRLQRFWVKYNKVLLDNAAIAQEQYHLEHENAKLRQLLKQYLDGISVNQDVMGQPNNLLQTGKFRSVMPDAKGQGASGRGGMNVTDGNKVMTEIVRQRAY